jgi:hypothetical protein
MKEILQMCLSIPNSQTYDPKQIEYLVHDKIRRSIADKIAHIATVETKHEFHKEYRCRVIVADHDDYWRDVKQAAEALTYNGYRPMFIEEGLT